MSEWQSRYAGIRTTADSALACVGSGELHPLAYVNDSFVIAQNARMVAINSALAVDLTGQVCADSIGHTFYSGFGGQTDFVRGAIAHLDFRDDLERAADAQHWLG